MAGFSKSRSGPAKVIWRNMDGRLGVAKLVDRMQLQQKDTAVDSICLRTDQRAAKAGRMCWVLRCPSAFMVLGF